MERFYKQSVKNQGWVVFWKENDDTPSKPLLCFGNWQSAAVEMVSRLRDCTIDNQERRVKLWAKNFNPEVKYSYCSAKNGHVILHKQKSA